MGNIVDKFIEGGNDKVILCDRGANFGYDNLVVDMLGFGVMKKASITHRLSSTLLTLCSAATRLAPLPADAARRLPNWRAPGWRWVSPACLLKRIGSGAREMRRSSALPLDKLEPFLKQMKAIDDLVKGFDELDTSK